MILQETEPDVSMDIFIRRKKMAIENDSKVTFLDKYKEKLLKRHGKELGDFLTLEEKAKKLKKLYAQKKPVKPKPTLDEWLQSIDPGGWASEEDKPMKKAGILEQELADEYWHNQHEKYLEMGGTLDFKEFMKLQLKRTEASRGGIVSLR